MLAYVWMDCRPYSSISICMYIYIFECYDFFHHDRNFVVLIIYVLQRRWEFQIELFFSFLNWSSFISFIIILNYGSGSTPMFVSVRGFSAIFFFLHWVLDSCNHHLNFACSSTEESSAVRMWCIFPRIRICQNT